MERRIRSALGIAAIVLVVVAAVAAMRAADEASAAVAPAAEAASRTGVATSRGGVASRAVTPVVAEEIGEESSALVDEAATRPVQGCAASRGELDCSFLEPSDETLADMARCGIVRYELPTFMADPEAPVELDAAWLARASVTEAEREVLVRVAAAQRASFQDEMVELADEVGLDPDWARQTALVVVVGAIQGELRDTEDARAGFLAQHARRRAGSGEPVPDDATPWGRATGRLLGFGDALEAALAEELGGARARELRATDDGWPGTRSRLGGGRCRPAPVPERTFVPRTAAQAQACLENWRGSGCGFLGPSPATLAEMARCGVVRFDIPTFLLTRDAEPALDPAWGQEVGMTPEETAVVAEVGEAFREQFYRDVSALALEIGKPQAWVDQTPLMGIMYALHEELDDEAEVLDVFRDIARERAEGRAPAVGEDATVHERFIRQVVDSGADFEAALAQRLGARAAELRTRGDGWPGNRVQTRSQCE